MVTYKVIIDNEGTTNWYNSKDRLHREDGPAVEFTNGHKYWYKDGVQHRTDGPAIEYVNGSKHWYVEGKRHRLGGPAVESLNGYKSWFIEGIAYSKAEYNKLQTPSCEGKVVEIDGKKYKLTGI